MRTISLIPVQIPRILGTALLAVTLCSCSLIIPENPSTARYNSVLGGPRKPQLNPGGSSGGSSAVERPAPMVQASVFPPVDPATEARASEIMAADVPPPPMANVRQTPSDNDVSVQVAGNYPDLHSVPPTPPMGTADSADARLARVRAQLEAERNGADVARNQLAIDAAAEPSLLDTPGVVPPPAPVNVVPVPPPVGMAPQSSLTTPNGSIALPPPPPPLGQSAGTAWDRAPAAPSVPAPYMTASAPAMEPIVLRAPEAAPAPSFAPQPSMPMPSNSPSMMPAMAGGFNPMAGTEPITLRAPTNYASGNYLPNSRYSTRRN